MSTTDCSSSIFGVANNLALVQITYGRQASFRLNKIQLTSCFRPRKPSDRSVRITLPSVAFSKCSPLSDTSSRCLFSSWQKNCFSAFPKSSNLKEDINAFAQANRRLYDLLHTHLYGHDMQYGSSALMWAAHHDKDATARKLLDEILFEQVTSERLEASLCVSAENGHEVIVRLFLTRVLTSTRGVQRTTSENTTAIGTAAIPSKKLQNEATSRLCNCS